MSKDKVSIGKSGEYFVAGELERRGYRVASLMANTPLFDILAIKKETNKQIAIQVKTSSGRKKEWTLGTKNESIEDDNVFYIFVSLNELDKPEYHIIPSKIVAETIKKEHQDWLNKPGKKEQKHNENKIRKFRDFENVYLNNWDCLK